MIFNFQNYTKPLKGEQNKKNYTKKYLNLAKPYQKQDMDIGYVSPKF